MDFVVVLMSVYNGERYLECQLDSIFRQHGVKVRLIVRDDGSTDNSLNILRTFQEKNKDSIFVLTGSNVGFAKSFSILVEYALKLYPDIGLFAFSDQDDYWHPEKMSKASLLINEAAKDAVNTPIVYASNTLLVDSMLRPIALKWKDSHIAISKANCLIQSVATGCTMVFNREAAILYSETVPENVRLHDFFMFRLGVFFGKFIWDPESYISYRQHETNQIGQLPFWGRMKRRIMKRKFLDHIYERDNISFLNSCRHLMTEEDIRLVESFCYYRKNFKSRLKLLFNQKIGMRNFEADFFYRIKVLLGTV